MALAVSLFGLFAMALGLSGVFSPERILGLVSRFGSRQGLYFIAGVRLLLGTALLLAAANSRATTYLQILGGAALFSGIVTPFFGVRRFEAILDWWSERPDWIVRVWSAFVLLFGLSLVWAVFPGLDRA